MCLSLIYSSTVLLSLARAVCCSSEATPVATDAEPSSDFSRCVSVPKECPNVNITFWLYTRSTRDSPHQLTVDNFSEATYDEKVPFVVLIHGYTGWKDYAPNPEMRAALFGEGDYNIISVDYAPVAKEPCYVQAAYNVRTVANCTSRLLLQMMDTLPHIINLQNLHIIGFSLGAQVAGNIGHYFKTLGNVTVQRMTGLDPALPLFDSLLVNADSRLTQDDAVFLDVYHTDAGNKGIVRPVGHVDFYLNDGYSQPGCGTNSSCDHYRAVVYYAESVDSRSIGFWGAACTTAGFVSYWSGSDICSAPPDQQTTLMAGYYTPHTANGTYQVMTNSTPPFALGKNPPRKISRRPSSLWG